MKHIIFLFTLLLLGSTIVAQASFDNIHSASEKVGEFVKIRGKIYNTYYANKSEGQPTFVNLDVYYKNSPLTILIPRNRATEFNLHSLKKGMEVIISGQIVQEEGYKPSIILMEEKQLQIMDTSISMK